MILELTNAHDLADYHLIPQRLIDRIGIVHIQYILDHLHGDLSSQRKFTSLNDIYLYFNKCEYFHIVLSEQQALEFIEKYKEAAECDGLVLKYVSLSGVDSPNIFTPVSTHRYIVYPT